MKAHNKKYGVYHWDTFDNETLLIYENDSRESCVEYIMKKYGKRISPHGADKVDIVDDKGNIVESFPTT